LKGLLTFHFTFRSSVKIIRPARALHTSKSASAVCLWQKDDFLASLLSKREKDANSRRERRSKKYEFIRVDGGGSSKNIVIESEIWLRLKRKSDFSCAPHWQLTFCASCETETAGV